MLQCHSSAENTGGKMFPPMSILFQRDINVRNIIIIAPASVSLALLLSSLDKNFNLTFQTHYLMDAIKIWLPLANYFVFWKFLFDNSV